LEDISLILSSVPRLTSITLRGRERDTIAWHNLDKTFQATFQNHLCSLSVTEASIEEIVGFPLSVFNRCKSLVHLSLHGRFRYDYGTSFTARDLPTLESLSIYNFRPLTNIFWLEALGNLGVLGFHSTKVEDFHRLAQLIDQYHPPCLRLHLSDTCNYISIKLWTPYWKTAPVGTGYNVESETFQAFPLSCFPSIGVLRQLTILAVGTIRPKMYIPSPFFPIITQFVQLIGILEDLTLRLHFECEEDHFSLSASDEFSISCLLEGSPSSRKITIHISAATQHRSIPPSEILSSLARVAILTKMVERGSLFLRADEHFCRHSSCCSQSSTCFPLRKWI